MKDLDVPKKTWKARFNSLFFKGQGLTFDNMDEGWIRAILNSTYDAFVMINSEGRITAWNPQAEKTFGWKREEVLGTTLQQTIIPQRFRQAHQNGMKHYLATGEGPVLNKRIEIDACHRDGHEIPVELTIFPIRIEDQLVFGSFLHDISERKRTESLQKAQLFVTNALADATTLDQAIPRLLEGICKDLLWSVGEFWIIDPQLDVLKCTHIWTTGDQSLQSFETRTRSLDFKKGEGLPGRVWLTGQATWIENVTTDANFLRFAEAKVGGLRGALSFPIEFDGKLIGVIGFFVSKSQQPDAKVLALMNDIGNRIGHFVRRCQAEEQLNKMNSELERRVAERTQDLAQANEQLKTVNRIKDEFLATVSHELRTPLNVIQGHSELLLDAPLAGEERQSIETIYRNAKVQGHLISDLLDVSRIISGKLQLEMISVDLKKVIEDALESVRIAAHSKNIEIQIDIDPSATTIVGDANRLQQVIWNLLTNAVKFTPKGGTVRVSLKKIDSEAQISVSDNGKGIETHFIPYVFERFRQEDATTTRRFGGLGIGLAIARHIVETHGGVIVASSAGKDTGATFTVNLPLISRYAQPVAPKQAEALKETSAQIQRLDGCRVLIIDDDEDTRNFLQRLLERSGAFVSSADSAKQAFQNLKQGKLPEVIISDIGMPGEDGYAFIQKLRGLPEELGRDLPAVALTAYAHEADQKRALSAGFQLHVAKPVDSSHLIEAVAQLRTSCRK